MATWAATGIDDERLLRKPLAAHIDTGDIGADAESAAKREVERRVMLALGPDYLMLGDDDNVVDVQDWWDKVATEAASNTTLNDYVQDMLCWAFLYLYLEGVSSSARSYQLEYADRCNRHLDRTVAAFIRYAPKVLNLSDNNYVDDQTETYIA